MKKMIYSTNQLKKYNKFKRLTSFSTKKQGPMQKILN